MPLVLGEQGGIASLLAPQRDALGQVVCTQNARSPCQRWDRSRSHF